MPSDALVREAEGWHCRPPMPLAQNRLLQRPLRPCMKRAHHKQMYT